MKELIEYRVNLINRLVAAAREFRAECLAARDVFTPPDPGEWNIHQIAAHTRDVHQLVYGARVHRTAGEDNPQFENFDGEAYLDGHYAADEPLETILNELVDQVETLAGMLRILPSEAWARQSSHVMLGCSLTLQSWVEKDLAHIQEHLRAIRQARKE